jgi:hypothetical protein
VVVVVVVVMVVAAAVAVMVVVAAAEKVTEDWSYSATKFVIFLLFQEMCFTFLA